MESGGDHGGHDRILGVVGTFVLDRIVGLPHRPEPVEDLGGIAYALSAAAATAPDGWALRPVARVGKDASTRVREWLAALGRQSAAPVDMSGVLEVPEPNNRVELRYTSREERTEHLIGGVGGWPSGELAARVAGCDALLVNFISGQEVDLDGAVELRGAFVGPVYADLHSLFLDTADDGAREPRALPEWRRWVASFDAVQMNETELDLMRGSLDADRAARTALRLGPSVVACTRGSRGVLCWSSAGAAERFRAGLSSVSGGGRREESRDASVTKREIPADVVGDADPTGCGDVWGGVMCCRLLAGEDVPAAAEAATRLAGVAAGSRGVTGLAERLAEADRQERAGRRGPGGDR